MNPKPLGPIATKVLFENNLVRVWDLTLQPGEATEWHQHHLDYMFIVIRQGEVQTEYLDGGIEQQHDDLGHVDFRRVDKAHRLVNTGAKVYQNIVVELKRSAADGGIEENLLRWLEDVFPDCPEVIEDLRRHAVAEPGRITDAYRELLAGYSISPTGLLTVTVDLNGERHEGIVIARKIPFLSFCPHHFLPFFGDLDIAYQPGTSIIGIGKLPRLVHCRSARFQIQELLTKDIAKDLMSEAKAKGVFVRCTARHMCVCYRGPKAVPTINVTTYGTGAFSNVTNIGIQELFS